MNNVATRAAASRMWTADIALGAAQVPAVLNFKAASLAGQPVELSKGK